MEDELLDDFVKKYKSQNIHKDKRTGTVYNAAQYNESNSGVGDQIEDHELNEYDQGLRLEMNQNANRANNMRWSTVRAIARLPRDIAGETVNTFGYLAAALSGDEIGEDHSILSKSLLNLGETLKSEDGRAISLYTNETGAFEPTNGEWWGKTITNFGPTIGMMIGSMGSGLMFKGAGAVAKAGFKQGAKQAIRGINQTRKIANKAKAAMKAGRAGAVDGASDFAQTRIYKEALNKYAKQYVDDAIVSGQLPKTMTDFAKTMTAAAVSRNAESLGAAEQLYKETLEHQKQLHPEYSEEQLKKIAGKAASDLYSKSMHLMLLDFVQYDGVYKALNLKNMFSKNTKKTLLKSLMLGSVEAVTEGVEEGLQYTFEQQVKDSLYAFKGEKSTAQTFWDSMDKAEFKDAFVQGLIGGGVFQGIGALGRKVFKNTELTKEDIEELKETFNVDTKNSELDSEPSANQELADELNSTDEGTELADELPEELFDSSLAENLVEDNDVTIDSFDPNLADQLTEDNIDDNQFSADMLSDVDNLINDEAEALSSVGEDISDLASELTKESIEQVKADTPKETFENVKANKAEQNITEHQKLIAQANKIAAYKGKNLPLLLSDIVDDIIINEDLSDQQKKQLTDDYHTPREEGDRGKFNKNNTIFKKLRKNILEGLAINQSTYKPSEELKTTEERLEELPTKEVANMTKATSSEELKQLGIKELTVRANNDYNEYIKSVKNPTEEGFRKSKFYDSTRQLNRVINDGPISETLKPLIEDNNYQQYVLSLVDSIGKDLKVEMNSVLDAYDSTSNTVYLEGTNPAQAILNIIDQLINNKEYNKSSPHYKRLVKIHKYAKKNIKSTPEDFQIFLMRALHNAEYAEVLFNHEINENDLPTVKNKFIKLLHQIITDIMNLFGNTNMTVGNQLIENFVNFLTESIPSNKIKEELVTPKEIVLSAKNLNIVSPYQFENGKILLDSNNQPVIKDQFNRNHSKWNGVNIDRLKQGLSPQEELTLRIATNDLSNEKPSMTLIHLVAEDGEIVGILQGYNPEWKNQPDSLRKLRDDVWNAKINNKPELKTKVTNITNNDIIRTNKRTSYDELTPDKPVIGIWNLAPEGLKNQFGLLIPPGTPIVTTSDNRHIQVDVKKYQNNKGEIIINNGNDFSNSNYPNHLGHPVIIVKDNSGVERLIPGDAHKFNDPTHGQQLTKELISIINNASDDSILSDVQEIVRWSVIPEGRETPTYYPQVRQEMRRTYSNTKLMINGKLRDDWQNKYVTSFNPKEHKAYLSGQMTWEQLKNSNDTLMYLTGNVQMGETIQAKLLDKNTLQPIENTIEITPIGLMLHSGQQIMDTYPGGLKNKFAQVNRDKITDPNYLKSIKNRFSFGLSPMNIFRIPDYSISLLSNNNPIKVKQLPVLEVTEQVNKEIIEEFKPEPIIENVGDELDDNLMDFLLGDFPIDRNEATTQEQENKITKICPPSAK